MWKSMTTKRTISCINTLRQLKVKRVMWKRSLGLADCWNVPVALEKINGDLANLPEEEILEIETGLVFPKWLIILVQLTKVAHLPELFVLSLLFLFVIVFVSNEIRVFL
ncbi:hypothetical protein DPMN_054679 [Dreissena polymorpha]|uniref:Uncharacterized protein n=1 Tax=Dreissena polymorpha TaxID=45954 RepID=A0A9D4CNJ7_DREPO|nr:hypothetical protein DPMN_054679 [Dreissena polymorpha]